MMLLLQKLKTRCVLNMMAMCSRVRTAMPRTRIRTFFKRVFVMTLSDVGTYEFCVRYMFYDTYWYL